MSSSVYDDRILKGVEEIAEYLSKPPICMGPDDYSYPSPQVSVRTVKKYINLRGLPATLIGGSYYSTQVLIDRWVKDQAREETKKRLAKRMPDGMKDSS